MADDYGEFYSIAECTGGQAELCACGQYADYPYDKIYDKIDVTNYMKQEKITLRSLFGTTV